MKYFCAIPPIAHPDLLGPWGVTDRILVLAQLLHKSKIYFESVMTMKNMGAYIIMDNGAAEGDQLSSSDFLAIVARVQPHEVVLPDSLLDSEKTIAQAKEWIPLIKGVVHNPVSIMAVPQGSTIAEWMSCFDEFVDNPAIDRLGFSKISVPHCFDVWDEDHRVLDRIAQTRAYCIQYLLKNRRKFKPTHLLGMGSPLEYEQYEGISWVEGTDSCYPILAAAKGQEFTADTRTRHPTPHDYFNWDLTPEQVERAKANIRFVDEHIPYDHRN